jgi:hypothetical protein
MPKGSDYGALILPAPKPAPRRPSAAPHPPAPSVNLRAPISAQPFRPAQQQAQRKVESAARALPQQPHPHIPLLPKPTPAQAHAVLHLAAERQRQSGVGKAAYYQALRNDPRSRPYVQAIEHYAHAANAHFAAQTGRKLDPALASVSPQALAQARAEAVAIGRQFLAQAHATAKPAPAPKDIGVPTFGLADIRIPGTAGLATGLSHALATVTPGLQGATPEAQFFRNLGKDALGIGELPLVGGYQVANAGLHAAGGDLRPAKQLAGAVAQGLERGAAGQLLKGNLSGAEQAVREHPLYSALEALGATGVAGRTAGALARGAGGDVEAVGFRGALARVGSQVRPPLALVDDAGAAKQGLVRQRTYSPDLLRKLAQVAKDSRREPVLDSSGAPVTIKDRGRTVPVLKPREGVLRNEEESLAKRRANFEAARTQAVEHIERENVRKASNAIDSPGRSPRKALRGALSNELVHLVATGTIRSERTFKADLEKRAREVETQVKNEGQYRTRAELNSARDNAKLLRQATASKAVARQIPEIVRQGIEVGKLRKGLDERLIGLDVHPRGELERSALSEYALAHMGARHFGPEDFAQVARQAAAEETKHAATAAEGPARIREARTLVEAAQAKEKLQRLTTTEQRPGSRGEGANATAAADRLIERLRAKGVTDLRRVPDSATAERLLAQTLAVARTAEAAQQEARARRLAATSRSSEAGTLRAGDGRVLTNAEIRAHAAAAGRNPDTLAHLPHVIQTGDKRAYHRQFRVSARPAPAHVSRTGALYARGSNVFGRQVVRDALTRSATTANLAEAVDKFVHEAGLRKANGTHFTPKEAVEAASRFEQEGGEPRFVPVRAFAAKLPTATRQAIADAQSSAQFDTAHQRLLDNRVITGESADIGHSTRNAVLVPKHLRDALEAQLKPASGLERSVQLLNAPFRMAVLPQPRWLTGNFIEPYLIRLPLSGAGVNLPGAALDIAAGRKALRAMERSGDPAQVRAAKEIRAQQFGGLFIGRRGASVRRSYQDFGGLTQRALYGAHVLRNLPAVKQLGDLTLSLPHAFFHVNRVIESLAQQQAFGKSVRGDIREITGKWSQTVLLGQRAVHEASEGLVDTPTQHRFMEDQYELLGQYGGQNPTTKRLIQTVAPFLPWTLASLRFVFWTLPAHHTGAFVALMKSAQSVQADWERQHADVPPGTLKDALVRPDGGLVDIARYTPFGATSPIVQGDLTNLTNTILPQLSGSEKALEGQDPFGRELQVPKTASNPQGKASGAQKVGIAGYSLAEALVPLLAQARRLREGGGTAYANSTIFSPKTKPGTSHGSAVNRTLNPFRETYLKAPKRGASSIADPYVRQEIQEAREEAKAALNDPYVKREIEEAKRAAAGR